MYDIFYIKNTKVENSDIQLKKIREKYPFVKTIEITENYFDVFKIAQKRSTTNFCWILNYFTEINEDCDLSYRIDQWDEKYIHTFSYNVYIVPKRYQFTKEEIKFNFFKHKKNIDITITNKPYDIFEIDSYEEYLNAIEKSKTEMFWMTSKHLTVVDDFDFNLYFYPDNKYDRKINHAFGHKNAEKITQDGVFLCSKVKTLSKEEVEERKLVNPKIWNIVASTPKYYDVFEIDSYEEYLNAIEKSTTEMFWITSKHLTVVNDFDFKMCFSHIEKYDIGYKKKINAFINQNSIDNSYDGIFLSPNKKILTKKELEYRSPNADTIVKWDIIASTKNQYDIVFITYDEPNADKIYQDLKDRFPSIKRVHGVKGIHQAHIAAAKLVNTTMFWVIDGDAEIVDTFDFKYTVPGHDEDIVHVWQSKNPINNLVYGYGGVKLLPRLMTINMELDKLDMTTSISPRFRSMQEISNITKFNTDSFSAWKSAFRECVKLSISSDQESIDRLETWCSVKNNVPFADDAIRGAIDGKTFGLKYKEESLMLFKINDRDWLEETFRSN